MEILKEFSIKDLTEQVTILNEIEKEKKFEAIPELFELYATPLVDDAVEYMIENTLRALLSQNEKGTVNGLLSNSSRVKKICIQIAGQNRFKSATSTLIDLTSTEENAEILFEILSSLAAIKGPESLEVFQRYIHHPETLISAVAVEMIGVYGDLTSLDPLCKMIGEAEADEHYGKCDLTTGNAIEVLAALKNDKAVSFLVSKIHHKNPTVRRLIQQALIKIGPGAVPFIAPLFDQEDVDQKILAANALGLIEDKKGGDILVAALDKGSANHPNIKFAIYEALGRIPFMKGLVCLIDGLSEEDDLILMAVVSSLNEQVNPGVIKSLKEIINADNTQSKRVIQAIVSSKALVIFESLYEDENISGRLIENIARSNDLEIISAFRKKLELMEGDRAKSDIERISTPSTKETGKKVLAVDDSKAMLLFYRSVASDMGIDVTTAVNGKEALDILYLGETFDLILTDMNMPIMDGIEFTRKARANPAFAKIPIIMVTTESESVHIQLADKVGVSDFMQKPFTPDMLQSKIKEHLQIKMS
ncbi:MAG: response regulator [Pseudomonadota bacterium]